MEKKTRGGARPGSGRKPTFKEPLDVSETVRFNEEQGAALGTWCRSRGVPPIVLIREVGLASASLEKLGLGADFMKLIAGKAKNGVALDGATSVPVTFTKRQRAAIRAYCERKEIAPGTFLKEATLGFIGAAKLGAAGQIRDLERLSKAAG